MIIRPGMTIGRMAAEADSDFLFECFVETNYYEKLQDIHTPEMIAVGRTGSGKTAILRIIEERHDFCRSLDPFENAMRYVSNSDILRFLHEIGADLDLLFQTLWKHILCIEFIKLRYGIENEDHYRNFIEWLADIFKNDKSKETAINYLSEYGHRFWIDRDENIKEILKSYESEIGTALSAGTSELRLEGKYGQQLSNVEKSEIAHRVKKIIDSEQLAKLGKVIKLLGQDPDSRKKYPHEYFVLIDQLDRNWVDDSVRFRLIGALIDVLPVFRNIPNLKIVVSLREDVIERVFSETKRVGSQREKFNDYIARLRWTKPQLERLVNKRIDLAFKRKYTQQTVTFDDLFRRNIDNKKPIDYMLERTQMRPRDLLSFLNHCLEAAEDKSEISVRSVKEAERNYAQARYDALCEEWESIFPALDKIIEFVVECVIGNRFGDIATSRVWEDLIIHLNGGETCKNDVISVKAASVLEEPTAFNIRQFAKEIICALYRSGVIGIKTNSDERFLFVDNANPSIDESMITDDTRFRLHKMIAQRFKIRE